MLRFANLALLILFPIAWFAPLLRAGLLPIFKLNEITIISGTLSLFKTDLILGLLVFLFAIVAPIAKILGTAAVQFNLLAQRWAGLIKLMGRFAMADIFLIALYVVIFKGGIGVGRLEIGWGLYLFSFCVIASLLISFNLDKQAQNHISKPS